MATLWPQPPAAAERQRRLQPGPAAAPERRLTGSARLARAAAEREWRLQRRVQQASAMRIVGPSATTGGPFQGRIGPLRPWSWEVGGAFPPRASPASLHAPAP